MLENFLNFLEVFEKMLRTTNLDERQKTNYQKGFYLLSSKFC